MFWRLFWRRQNSISSGDLQSRSLAKLSLCSFCSLSNIGWAIVVQYKIIAVATRRHQLQSDVASCHRALVWNCIMPLEILRQSMQKAAKGKVHFVPAEARFIGAADSRICQEYLVRGLWILGGFSSSHLLTSGTVGCSMVFWEDLSGADVSWNGLAAVQ